MFFLLEKGLHKEGDVTYKKGDIIESDMNLAQVFRGKFTQVAGTNTPKGPVGKQSPVLPETGDKGKAGVVAKTTTPAKPEPDEDIDLGLDEDVEVTDDGGTTELDLSKYGNDVTDKVSMAAKLGCLVCRKGNWYNVLDAKDGEPLNDKALRKAEVVPFLKTLKV